MGYDREAVGRRIKSGYIDKGMTSEEFAKAVGVTRATVAEWVAARTVPSFENAYRICETLDWPLDRLAVRE